MQRKPCAAWRGRDIITAGRKKGRMAIMTTEERIERLERKNRFLVAGLVVVAAIMLVVNGVSSFPPGGAASPPSGEIEATRFLLVDENGKPRAALALDDGRPALGLLDENGKPRAALRVSDDGPRLVLVGGRQSWMAPPKEYR